MIIGYKIKLGDSRHGKNKEELLKQAKRRVFLRKSVVWHLVSYVAVNVL